MAGHVALRMRDTQLTLKKETPIKPGFAWQEKSERSVIMSGFYAPAITTASLIRNRVVISWLIRKDLEYHLLRASMVIIFLFFGYQKWFEYEARVLLPYIGNGPLIFWLYPAFGIRGASWFLGVAEWLVGSLLFLPVAVLGPVAEHLGPIPFGGR